jgi:hypothetical protein
MEVQNMEKTTAIESNRLWIAITLIIITGLIIYFVLALAIQNQFLNPPWQELASVGWVSEITL